MKVRISKLARELGMESKKLLALLKKWKYPVATVSSGLDPQEVKAVKKRILEEKIIPAAKPKKTEKKAVKPSVKVSPQKEKKVRVSDLARELGVK
ncbi:MAG TPA: translation initiation factor IF-2 N-terminal domain-containing protein, partial [bacterium]|nr:translation initiation factor IF-2 N-terminal domain-containing protein [bacterium]